MMRHNLEALEGRLLLATRPLHPALALSGQEVEPNDTIDTATPLARIGLGIPCYIGRGHSNFICPPNVFRGAGRVAGVSAADPDIDYFTFPTLANARVSLYLEGPAVQQGASFDLVAPDGSVLASAVEQDRDGDGIPDTASLEYSAQTAGKLFVRISDQGTVPAEGLEYHLGAVVRVERNVEHEPNDTFDEANEITLKWYTPDPVILSAASVLPIRPLEGGFGYIRGELGNGSTSPDTDFYRFTTGASLDIDVRVIGTGAQDGHLTVYDTDHNVIAEAGPGTEPYLSVSFRSTTAGVYFAQLTDTGTVACITTPCLTYSLQISARRPFVNPYAEHEPNDTLDTANPLRAFPPPIRITRFGNGLSGTTDPSGVANIACIDCPGGSDQFVTYLARGDFSTGSTSDPDQDYFSFEAAANRKIVVSLDAATTAHLQLLDATGNVLIEDTTSAVAAGHGAHGSLEYFTQSGGTFYVLIEPSGGSPAQGTDSHYGLRVTVRREPNTEHEPNDTVDTANVLQLRVLPTLAPGIELRGGTAQGVAGGPTADQDFYRFDVHAGEHVLVDVQEREIDPGHFEVTVYDAAGNEVGKIASDAPGAVSFDAPADATYYALVKASATAPTDQSAPYRLVVLARSHYGRPIVNPVSGIPPRPAVIVLSAGRTFAFTDSSGDSVQVSLSARTGQATITFSQSVPDGSDIMSVELVGVRNGGSFTVQTAGSAEIGSIAIHGTGSVTRRRGGSRPGNFDTVQVAGNVGRVSSEMNLRSVAISGMLGELSARGQQIGQVRAALFDAAMADVGSIRTLAVQPDIAQGLFDRLLP